MATAWQPLEPGPFGRRVDAPDADPLWIWADATGYRDFGAVTDDPQGALWCLVERDGTVRSERHTSATAADLATAELAMAVVPQRMPPAPAPVGEFAERAVLKSEGGCTLVGIIDSGCPFAAPMLRRGGGTRVLGLWDQDDAPAFPDRGYRPAGAGYGRAVDRGGLNAYLAAATGPGGWVDEEWAYRLAAYDRVRPRMSHGAAVISQLFGGPLHGGSLQPQPGSPPAWDVVQGETLPIDVADLVFVDIARADLQDSTSGALARYVLDGVRFILAHAQDEQRVVINISTGTSRTTHDGSSMLEQALRDTIADARRERGIVLTLVLPVGNGNMEQRHAVLSDRETDSDLTLFLPPGCEMPQFVTVRWPERAQHAALVVTPPGGPRQVIRRGEAWGLCVGRQAACAGVVWPPSARRPSRSLLAFGPTASHDPAVPLAPAGRWRLALEWDGDLPLDEPVAFWISLNHRNPGALPRGRQADFVDWDRSHHPEAWLRYREEDPPAPPVRNGIRRLHACTGLATTATPASQGVLVVGSVYAAPLPGRPSRYSAEGPRGWGLPQYGAPGDASRALPGLSVRGNHAGEIVRMVGTSFSAPLVARACVNGTLPAWAGPGAGRVGQAIG